MRDEAARASDVRRLIQAARVVVRDRARVVDDLARATGLSREGVELGLTRHLEVDATDDEIAALVRAAGDATEVRVVLSANVFVAALRAIAIARAAAARVVVRPSRREPTFARALVEAAADPAIAIAEEIDLARVRGGEVHVYGRDATIASVRAAVGDRARVVGHGAGMGIAIVTAAADRARAAAQLAEDVIAFDQRGCLSPRVALVEGDDAAAEAFGARLHDALAAAAARVPRGELAPEERSEAARWAATIEYVGTLLRAPDHAVGIAPADAPLAVPPPGRHVHVAAFARDEDLRARVGPIARAIVAVGCDDVRRVTSLAPPHARVSALGAMQRPRLDGPVDRRGT